MSSRWSLDCVERLLEAWEREPNLYVLKDPRYHNKHLRAESVKRVLQAVKEVRPNTTSEELTKKIHALRNNFNTEHKKVKASQKSGAGTAEVYKPTLAYYNKAMFFAEHFCPRKSIQTAFSSAGESEAPSVPGSNTSESFEVTIDDGVVIDGDIIDGDLFDLSEIAGDVVDAEETDVDRSALSCHDYSKRRPAPTPIATSTQIATESTSGISSRGDRRSSVESVDCSDTDSTFRTPSSASSIAAKKRRQSSGPDTDRIIQALETPVNVTLNVSKPGETPSTSVAAGPGSSPADLFVTFVRSFMSRLSPEDQNTFMNSVWSLMMQYQSDRRMNMN